MMEGLFASQTQMVAMMNEANVQSRLQMEAMQSTITTMARASASRSTVTVSAPSSRHGLRSKLIKRNSRLGTVVEPGVPEYMMLGEESGHGF